MPSPLEEPGNANGLIGGKSRRATLRLPAGVGINRLDALPGHNGNREGFELDLAFFQLYLTGWAVATRQINQQRSHLCSRVIARTRSRRYSTWGLNLHPRSSPRRVSSCRYCLLRPEKAGGDSIPSLATIPARISDFVGRPQRYFQAGLAHLEVVKGPDSQTAPPSRGPPSSR